MKIQNVIGVLLLVAMSLKAEKSYGQLGTGVGLVKSSSELNDKDIYWLLTGASASDNGQTVSVAGGHVFQITGDVTQWQTKFLETYNSYVDQDLPGFTQHLNVTDRNALDEAYADREIKYIDEVANVTSWRNSYFSGGTGGSFVWENPANLIHIKALCLHNVPMVKMSGATGGCANLISCVVVKKDVYVPPIKRDTVKTVVVVIDTIRKNVVINNPIVYSQMNICGRTFTTADGHSGTDAYGNKYQTTGSTASGWAISTDGGNSWSDPCCQTTIYQQQVTNCSRIYNQPAIYEPMYPQPRPRFPWWLGLHFNYSSQTQGQQQNQWGGQLFDGGNNYGNSGGTWERR